jgi:predicted ATPase
LRTGERLEQGYGQRAGEIAGELAMHFAEGRDFARAARYHHQAGEIALRQHGYREAADHLTRALDLLKSLPDSQERARQELVLYVMLGSALTALKGHAGREVEQAYARARDLCEQVDDTSRLFPVLLALGWFYLIRGSQDAARDVGRRLLGMAETTGDPAIFLGAHHALGVGCFYGGEFETAIAHLERGIELYDPTAHSPTRSSAFRLNVDSGLSCTLHAAWALWVLGYPARAATRMQEALELAPSIDHPFSLAHGHRFAAAFHQSLRARAASHEQAERSLALSTEHGFGAVLMAANFHRGWLLARQGREEDGLALMRAWVAACREIRSECLLPGYLAWLAEVYGDIGRPQEGLDLVDEALATGTQSGNHYWTAELYRLRGALAGTEKDAESSFVEAIAIARRQRAKSFELRAATSLSRLWGRQGKTREAHALLAEAYAWFTEGFDTADLTDARALLEELERAVTP